MASAGEDEGRTQEVIHVVNLTRECALGCALGFQVIIDQTGWIRGEPEVLIHRGTDGQLYPLALRMSPETPNNEVVGERPVNTRFAEYNALLLRLRDLAHRAECEVVRLDAEADTPIGCAHRELAQLDNAIAKRQAQAIGSNVIRLTTLDREILAFHRWESELQPIIAESETALAAPPTNRVRPGIALMLARFFR